MFGRDNHVSCTKQGVGAGSVNAEFFAQPVNFEIHFSAGRFSNPVALHVFYASRPVEAFQSLQQPFAVMWNTEQPLFQVFADNRVAAFFVRTIGQHFFVGTNRFARIAPPNLCVVVICQTFIADVFFYGFFAFIFNFFRNYKFRNGAAFLLFFVKPGVVQLLENPLRPFKIFRIGGVNFAVPVVAQPDGFNLSPEIVAVQVSGNSRVGAGLNGILLGRKSKCIVSHRVEYVKTLHPFVAAQDIGCRVTFRVPHVQTRPRRIGKHIENVIFRF